MRDELYQRANISIHALRKESDVREDVLARDLTDFNPRSP